MAYAKTQRRGLKGVQEMVGGVFPWEVGFGEASREGEIQPGGEWSNSRAKAGKTHSGASLDSCGKGLLFLRRSKTGW